ncbi:class III lanthionine synthetase LanKC [Streptomyces sp. NPDC001780]
MKLHYVRYCQADSPFYDEPRRRPEGHGYYLQAGQEPPAGWTSGIHGPWVRLAPRDARLPPQGWKVHVSARPETAQLLLDRTFAYCVERRIPFKFLAGETELRGRNHKYADRGGSGKFITVYPVSDAQLHALLTDLDPRLKGLGGPHILSDLRWADGPLHLRYGAFAERYVHGVLNTPEPAIETPDGRLVADTRSPVFRLPEWVRPPAFLAAALRERTRHEAPPRLPYTIDSALHFSNGGGVYLATDRRTGQKVVLKEARPHAGLDQRGRDAVQRLRHERDVLRELADVEEVVDCVDSFQLWEHHFLVLSHAEGVGFHREVARRTPLHTPEAGDRAFAEYTVWATDVLDKIGTAVRALHAKGFAFGDLHPGNIVLTPDGGIRLLDFEMAVRSDDPQDIRTGAPGFAPPTPRSGVLADRYALGCLRLSVFLPLTAVLPLDPSRAAAHLRFVTSRFPVSEHWASETLELLAPHRPGAACAPGRPTADGTPIGDLGDAATANWPAIEASVARAVWNSATPRRDDRLFPGDVEQFVLGGLGFGYGAAGVLYAMARAGHGRREEYEAWLLDAVRRSRAAPRHGFYDGLHGIAYAFEAIGDRDAALEVLDRAEAPLRDGVVVGDDLGTGQAGVVLNRLHFARRLGDRGLRAEAVTAAHRIADRLTGVPLSTETAGRGGSARRAGLLHGASGLALMFTRLYEETDDHAQEYLDLAERAVRLDLERCVLVPGTGALQVDEGRRMMPYIATGSAGIGLALLALLRHRRPPDLLRAMNGLLTAALPVFHVFPGLFTGTAGQLGFLQQARRAGFGAHDGPGGRDGGSGGTIATQHDRLRLHMTVLRGEIAFPGEQLMRLSMDFGTGSAGILHTLATLRDDRLPLLPFVLPFTDDRRETATAP